MREGRTTRSSPFHMPCNQPLSAWRTKAPNDNGRHPPTFVFTQADTSQPMEIPCGRCTGCRLERARNWAVRLLHEAKLYEHNHFITLTYNDASLPSSVQGLPTLQPEHFTRFMKRLRKSREAGGAGPPALAPGPLTLVQKHGPSGPDTPINNRIRYYQCGEYGERTNRPHHHAILFNLYLPDLRPLNLARARTAHTLYTSPELERIWTHGMVSVGRVTFETAAYVASYVLKKITGPKAQEHYQDRVHEYATMSRRPGLGSDFLTRYADEIIENDSVIIRGVEMRPPKFYDRTLERRDPERWYQLRDERALNPKHITRHREREARETTQKQNLRKRDAQ